MTLILAGPLRPYAQGARRLVLDGEIGSVAEALTRVAERHPGVVARVLDERGELRPHVNVFLGHESVRALDGLATRLPPDAELHVLPAVSGG